MEKFTILIVDDIEANIYSLKLILEDNFDEEIEVLEATSAQEALLHIMKNDIDLILSDIQMPDVDGFELITYLQNIEETKDIPVILITGIHDDVSKMKKGYDLGAIDYLTKPIDDVILVSKLKVYLSIYEERKEDKKTIELKDKLLLEQIKINSIIENLDKLSPNIYEDLTNNEDYKSLLLEEENMIDLDSVKKSMEQ